MIRGITAGPGIHISNGSFSTPYVDMNRPSAGLVRYNGSSLEVYDGSSWITMNSSYPQVELDGLTMEILIWARKKMEQERHIQDLAARHPTVADAVAARERADEAVHIAMALCDVK